MGIASSVFAPELRMLLVNIPSDVLRNWVRKSLEKELALLRETNNSSFRLLLFTVRKLSIRLQVCAVAFTAMRVVLHYSPLAKVVHHPDWDAFAPTLVIFILAFVDLQQVADQLKDFDNSVRTLEEQLANPSLVRYLKTH